MHVIIIFQVPRRRLVFKDNAIELIAAKTEMYGDARVSLGLASDSVQRVFEKSEAGRKLILIQNVG